MLSWCLPHYRFTIRMCLPDTAQDVCMCKAIMGIFCCMDASSNFCRSIFCPSTVLMFHCGCLLQFDNTAVTAGAPAVELGPITGAVAPATATKSERVMLPANALLPTTGPAAAPLANARTYTDQRSRSADAPSPIVHPRKRARAPIPGPQHAGTPAAAPTTARGV